MFCDWRHKRCVCAWYQSQVEAWCHGGGFIAAKLRTLECTKPPRTREASLGSEVLEPVCFPCVWRSPFPPEKSQMILLKTSAFKGHLPAGLCTGCMKGDVQGTPCAGEKGTLLHRGYLEWCSP